MQPTKALGKRVSSHRDQGPRSVLKQKRFPTRLTTIKTDAQHDRPSKRRKTQTTMTQLDFGKRSFLDIIGNSDDSGSDSSGTELFKGSEQPKVKRRKSRLPAKTESQGTLTQLVRGKDGRVRDSDDSGSGSEVEEVKPAARFVKRARRAKGIAKTESQDTLTQFVKRSSDLSGLVRDSEDEDEEGLSDVSEIVGEVVVPNQDGEGAEESTTRPPILDTVEGPQSPELGGLPEPEQHVVNEEQGSNPSPGMHLEDATSINPLPPPKTPQTKRTLAIPDSVSSAGSHISTRSPMTGRTQRQFYNLPFAPESPLEAKSSPVRPGVEHERVRVSPVRPIRLPLQERPVNRILDTRASTAVPPKKLIRAPSPRKPAHSPSKPAPVPTMAAPHIRTTESQRTRRRVQDFNERFAILERENSEQRRRLMAGMAPRRGIVRSSTSMSSRDDLPALRTETQYPDVGEETQNEIMEKLMDAAAVEGPENAQEIEQTEEHPVSSKPDTQDLASDQLLRETQQAPVYSARHASNITITPPSSLMRPPSQQPHDRPSQATTVDETMRDHYPSTITQVPSSPRTHNILQQDPDIKCEDLDQGPDIIISSSPFDISAPPPTFPLAHGEIVISSSPLATPPELDTSPGVPAEPKTPNILRSKGLLQMEDLVSDSLGESLLVGPPPGWADEEEDDDDGEL